MLLLTAEAYALQARICQPMPNGQYLQIIWGARVLRVVSSRKPEHLTGVALIHLLTTAVVSQPFRVVSAATKEHSSPSAAAVTGCRLRSTILPTRGPVTCTTITATRSVGATTRTTGIVFAVSGIDYLTIWILNKGYGAIGHDYQIFNLATTP